jgi:hypothetical protein
MSNVKITNFERVLELCKPEVISIEKIITGAGGNESFRSALNIPRVNSNTDIARHGLATEDSQNVALPTKGCVEPMVGNEKESLDFIGLPATEFAHKVLFSSCPAVSIGYEDGLLRHLDDDTMVSMSAMSKGLQALSNAEDMMIYQWLRNRGYAITNTALIANNSFTVPLASPALYPTIAPAQYFSVNTIGVFDTLRAFMRGVKTVARSGSISLVMGQKALADFVLHNEVQAAIAKGSMQNFGAQYLNTGLLNAEMSTRFGLGGYNNLNSPMTYIGTLPSLITGGQAIALYVANETFCVYEKAAGWVDGDSLVLTPWLKDNEMAAFGTDQMNSALYSHRIDTEYTRDIGMDKTPMQYIVEPLIEQKFSMTKMVGMNFRMTRSLYMNPQAFHIGVVTADASAGGGSPTNH